MLLRPLTAFILVVAMAAPAVADEGKDEAHAKERKEHKGKHRSKAKDWKSRGYDGYFHEHGYTTLGVPEGHLPSPGKCRLWYLDRPRGHQPPPESSGHLRAHAPVGGWLIHQPMHEPHYVDVSGHDAY